MIGVQLVADDETPIDPALQDKSAFLHAAFRLGHDVVIGNAAADIPDDTLTHPFENVQPKGGVITFELATELPFYLPTVAGQHEYLLNVNQSEMYVCLRMIRGFIGTGYPAERGTTYILVHRRGLDSAVANKNYGGIHPVPIKTFVSQRFSGEGASADKIIQKSFFTWRDEFVRNIAGLLDAIRASRPDAGKHLLPHVSPSSFTLFWVVAGDKSCAQFVGELGLAAIRSIYDIPGDHRARLAALLSSPSPLPTHEHALSLARTYAHYGYFGLAVVQICVACEIILAQNYRNFLTKRGVSKKALDDNRRDITFSQLLQLHLFAMRDITALSDGPQIVQKINWARGLRNDVVHDGVLQKKVTAKEIEDAVSAAERLITFLHTDPHAIPSSDHAINRG